MLNDGSKTGAMVKRPAAQLALNLCCLCMLVCAPVTSSMARDDTRECVRDGESPLSRWTVINRGLGVFDPLSNHPGAPPGSGRSMRLRFPVAVAARSNDVYIYDAGIQAIVRYDLARETLTRFADVPVGRPEVDLYIGDDLSVYFVNTFGAEVLRYAPSGVVLKRFSNSAELPRPVAAVLGRTIGEIMVADGLRNHILVFNQLGGVVGSLGAQLRDVPGFRSIAGLARRGDRIYIVDQIAARIVVAGLEDGYYASFGDSRLSKPISVAVDRYDRVFVADAADNTIKVFTDGVMGALAGGFEATADMRFAAISDLWIDQDYLFVADGPNARVQVLQIRAPCP